LMHWKVARRKVRLKEDVAYSGNRAPPISTPLARAALWVAVYYSTQIILAKGSKMFSQGIWINKRVKIKKPYDGRVHNSASTVHHSETVKGRRAW